MDHREFLREVEGLMVGYWLTDLSNFSALVYHGFPKLNWAGFYLSDGQKLRLGPFAGKVACTEIAFDRGVCGASFSQGKLLIVDNVDEFPGHIACDPASKSELVIPFRFGTDILGVLDLDAPVCSRFQPTDGEVLAKALEILADKNPILSARPWTALKGS